MEEANPSRPSAGAYTWRDGARPVLALALAVLFFAVFGAEALNRGLPGLGVAVFVWAYFGAVLLVLGKRARWSFASALTTAGAGLISLSCAVWGGEAVTALNCLLLLFLGAAAAFLLSGRARSSWTEIRLVPETVGFTFCALFGHIPAPFRALGRLRRDNRPALSGALLGCLIAVPLLAAVIALLASADSVFGGLFSGLFAWLDSLDAGRAIWHVARALILGLFLCSGLYALDDPPRSPKAKADGAAPRNVPLLIPALLLDAVYLLFCVIQGAYLFGGREAASMAGGWAQYARSGFFQLAAVAALNLSLCAGISSRRRFSAAGGLLLRLALAGMLLCTAVILVSAFWRMRLYILAFGLSLLRLLTLWGMAVIAVCILAAAWKLFRPDFRVWGVLAAFGLASWCALCLLGPGRLVADYNVDAYADGRLSQIDTQYLISLSADALPALRRLASECPDCGADAAVRTLEAEAGQDASWTTWRLSLVLNR